MTRIGIMSDIHANSLALNIMVRKLRQQHKVRKFWLLGDTFGYGPLVEQTLQTVTRLRPEQWLAGNHDHYIVPRNLDDLRKFNDFDDVAWKGDGLLNGPTYANGQRTDGPHEDAWEVALRHRHYFAENDFEVLQLIAELPAQQHPQDNIFLAHAVYSSTGDNYVRLEKSVRNPSQFLPFVQSEPIWQNLSQDIPILHIGGHTHLPSLWRYSVINPAQWDMFDTNGSEEPIPDKVYELKPGYFYYINPGSIGFPRGRYPCPSACILDLNDWTVTYINLNDGDYNSESIRQMMESFMYPADLWSQRQLKTCSSYNYPQEMDDHKLSSKKV